MRPPINGSTFVKYRLNTGRSIAFAGLENSSTATQPPGFNTLRSSAKPPSTLARLRNPNAIVTASNEPSRNGKASASPSIKGTRCAVLLAAISNIGRQKSVPTTLAPVFSNNVRAKTPVPHATSSTRALPESLSRTLVATIRRQRLSTLPESRWFKRSYRFAIPENISRTRPACSFAAFVLSGTVKPNLVQLWLQDACEHFVITWDSRCFVVLPVVSVKALERELRRALHTAHVPVRWL